MRYPYKLSETRLSLLSPEERAVYEREHSIFYSKRLRSLPGIDEALAARADERYAEITADAEVSCGMTEQEMREMGRALAEVECRQLFDSVSSFIAPYCRKAVGEDYDRVMENCSKEFARLCTETKPVNEAGGTTAGHDMTFWIPGMDWLFNLSGTLLAGAMTGIVALIMAGKDKVAAKLLERYMNKLVELTDCGVNKKRPWYSVFTGGNGKDYHADKSKACFRSIQECVERDMCVSVMVAAKACGMFGDDPINEMQNRDFSKGGLLGEGDSFKTRIADVIESVSKRK